MDGLENRLAPDEVGDGTRETTGTLLLGLPADTAQL